MSVKRFGLTVLLCCCWLLSWSVNYRFRHIASSDGLPHQQVEALAQDAKGNIWMGTRNGLARYDGYDIRSYFHEDADSCSLNHNFVIRLFVDGNGRIWVCTQRGICRYRPETDDFRSYDTGGIVNSVVQQHSGRIICGGMGLWVYDEQADCFRSQESTSGYFVASMTVDDADNVYVATNRSVFCYDAALTRVTSLDAILQPDFLTGTDDILPIFYDSQGRLWLGRNGEGVMTMDGHGRVEVLSPAMISNGIVRVIAEDAQQRIWLGTEKGVTIVHPDGHIEIVRHRFDDPYRLSDNAIYSIISDVDDNIWIGSYFGGVDVLLSNNKQFQWLEPGLQGGQIHGKVPRQMVETEPGVFWIATEDGGLNIYNRQAGTVTLFDRLPQLGTNVHSLYYDRSRGEMWIGTFRSGLFRYNLRTGAARRYNFTNGLKSNSFFSIACQQNGRLWFATTKGLYYYDGETDQFKMLGDNTLDNQFVYTLFVDAEDNLWVGMCQYGLYRIASADNRITYWQKAAGGLRDNYVTSLYRQPGSNRLWIGTNNCGLQYMDLEKDSFESIESDMLLPHITVCSIISDVKGRLWVSTSQGLYQYSMDTETLMRYTTESGLPTNQFNFSSALATSDSLLTFGTVNGMISFNPLTLSSRKGPLTVHLKHLLVNNQEMTASVEGSPLKGEFDETQSLTLSYDQARLFSIEYGVIMPGNTTSIEYQVRLDGIDKDWRNVGSERKFTGYKLPPGTYQLFLRANDANEGWDDCPVKALRIVVQPPFYRSKPAYLLYLLLLCALAYVAYRLFSIREKERSAVREANMERDKIEAIDKAKFDFFTNISHELKTPLSLIVAPLRSISRQQLDESSNRHLDMAIKNTRKMESLINELVTFNKVETDSFPFYVQKGNPLQFIEMILYPYHEMAGERGLTLTSEFEDNGEEVWFSPSYVEHIVSNLLSNAMKFTPSGGRIMVKGSITESTSAPSPTSPNAAYLCLSVQDTGIGIAKEEQGRIFNHYYQTKRGYNADNSGWGIGLSLVQRLSEIHKGRVSVESEPGHGAKFTVWLNVSDSAFPTASYLNEDKTIVPLSEYKFSSTLSDIDEFNTRHSTPTTQSPTPGTLLIVDDNRDLLDFLSNYFSSKYTVLTASNGREALEIARTEAVQMVVSDVMMPEMDGIELCRQLKGDVHTSHIPVILLTAKSEQDDVAIGYKSGAEAYVSKPFDPQILELQVNNIMQLLQTRQQEIVDELDVPSALNSQPSTLNSSPSAPNPQPSTLNPQLSTLNFHHTTLLSEIDKTFIRQLNEVIEQHIADSDFAIADITSQLAISRSLLHTKMKSLTGMSMGDYIRKRRLYLACQFLREGYNVSETAYRTGFSDPSYFSKAFKKQMGVSPTEYINVSVQPNEQS